MKNSYKLNIIQLNYIESTLFHLIKLIYQIPYNIHRYHRSAQQWRWHIYYGNLCTVYIYMYTIYILKAAHGVFRPLHVGLDLVGLFRSARDRILHQIKCLIRRACFSRIHHGCTISQRNRDEKLIKCHMEHFRIRS